NKKIESMNITRFVIFSIEEIAKVLSGSKQMK
ncbi:DNA-binding protein, partial [Campylobacter jejuni]|nr:DNA-binding protein [Campylobacter jejuni]